MPHDKGGISTIVPNIEKTLAEHKEWLDSNFKEGKRADLCGADLCNANLRNADLCGANLRNADLRGADIDFSCWPLWCGSFDVIVDRRIAAQLAYHFCRVICDAPEVVQCQKALYQLANTFHRVGELPRLGND